MGRRMSLAQERRAWAHFVETGEEEAPRNKFNAEKKECNGRVFHSKMEADRAVELQWGESLGEISNLRYQVRYEVIPEQKGESAVFYIADFVYLRKDGQEVVEDSKGHRTEAYRIKRKLMLKVHGIRILETGRLARPSVRRRRSKR